MSRRGASDLIHDILRLIQKGVMLRTHVMYQSNTSWNTAMKYLDHLEKKKCIIYLNRHYHITDKGARVLDGMERLKELRP